MANIGTWLGDTAHTQLISGASKDLVSHMTMGAMAGAAYGGGMSLWNNTGTPINDAVHGAMTGAILGIGSRYASSRYATGMHSTVGSIMDAGKARAGTEMSKSGSAFSMNYFTAPANRVTSIYHIDGQVVSDLASPKGFMKGFQPAMRPPVGGYKT